MKRRTILYISFAALVSEPAKAQAYLIRIEAICPDADILYEIQKAANDEARALKDTKLVSDDSANIRIRVSVTPIQNDTKEPQGYKGVAIAAVVSKMITKDSEQIRRFTHQLVPMNAYINAVRSIVKSAVA